MYGLRRFSDPLCLASHAPAGGYGSPGRDFPAALSRQRRTVNRQGALNWFLGDGKTVPSLLASWHNEALVPVYVLGNLLLTLSSNSLAITALSERGSHANQMVVVLVHGGNAGSVRPSGS